MADLPAKDSALPVKIVGDDEANFADVFLESGVKRLQTSGGTITVNELLGETVFPFTYIEINTVGSNGDTLRTQIAAPSAVDVTTTKTASEVTDNDFAKKHRDELNADGNFSSLYKATTPRDSFLICIESLLIQTLRPIAGDVSITDSGTLTATLGFDTVIDRPIALAIFPHPRDCRKGTINVTGEIGILETGRPPTRLLLETSGNSPAMNVDGSSVSVEFKLSNNANYDPTRDFVVTELRLEATAGSIQIGKYVEVPELTNGHMVQIRSDGNLEYQEDLKLTDDIFHAFAFGGGSKFQLILGSGNASLVAVFARPFFIRKVGSFGTDDDVVVTVQDDLSPSGIKRLQISAVGFFED